jgi:hypothetical protein
MRKFWHENSLSIVLLLCFLGSVAWQYVSGYAVYAEDQDAHSQIASTLGYLPHFAHSVMENWQSEFLQVLVYVQFSRYFRQKGSHESKPPDASNEENT